MDAIDYCIELYPTTLMQKQLDCWTEPGWWGSLGLAWMIHDGQGGPCGDAGHFASANHLLVVLLFAGLIAMNGYGHWRGRPVGLACQSRNRRILAHRQHWC